MKIKKSIVFGVVIIAVCALLIIVLTHVELELNNYHSLKVATSKRTVFESLVNEKIQFVSPELENYIALTNDNGVSLDVFKDVSGVCITNNKGLFLKLVFDEQNILQKVINSGGRYTTSFKNGQSKFEVMNIVKEMMKNYKKLIVSSCIAEHRWINLKEFREDDFLYISKYDKWTFQAPNSYSTIDLEFTDNSLEKIIYHFRYFEP